jgi:GAF domain-containing protein
MATIDGSGRFLLTPDEPEEAGRTREALLAERGLTSNPDPGLDAFAADLARAAAELTGAETLPFAMVNLIGAGQAQYFAGLHVPEGPGGEKPEVGRTMERDLGYCVHALDRGKALVLEDVTDTARYATNGVVGGIGVRTYLGAPLIDEETGIAYGTICVVDTQPRPWGKEGLELIRRSRDQLSRYLEARKDGHT